MSSSPFVKPNHKKLKVFRPVITEEEIAAVAEVMRSGNLVQGEQVKAFEQEFAQAYGVDAAIAVNSGTTALQACLLSLDLGPEDEVIVPSISFFATVEAVLWAGAKLVFCDVDANGNMNPRDLKSRITSKTAAIIPVHYMGIPCQIEEIVEVAFRVSKTHYTRPIIIEDCSQAHLATVSGKAVGTFGDYGCFSLYATKHMTTGEGGMIICRSGDREQYIRRLRIHGMSDYHTHLHLGHNWRMNEIQAAMGRKQLEQLPDRLMRIRANAAYLTDKIEGSPLMPLVSNAYYACREISWYSFPIQFAYMPDVQTTDGYPYYPKREFVEYMDQAGIEVNHRYDMPMYRQPVVRQKYGYCDMDASETFARSVVGLPCRSDMTVEQLDKVVSVVNDWRKK